MAASKGGHVLFVQVSIGKLTKANFFRLHRHDQYRSVHPHLSFSDNSSIVDTVIHYKIIPLVDSLRVKMGLHKINYYDPLRNAGSTFPDGIPPNNTGALMLAKIVFITLTNQLTLGAMKPPKSSIGLTSQEAVTVTLNNN